MRGCEPQLIYPLIWLKQGGRTLGDGDKTPTQRCADLACQRVP